MNGAEDHFTAEALGEPAGPGRYVNVDSIKPVEFVPGLGFRPFEFTYEDPHALQIEPDACGMPFFFLLVSNRRRRRRR